MYEIYLQSSLIQSFTALCLVVFTNLENVGSPDLALRTEAYEEGELESFCGIIYTFYAFFSVQRQRKFYLMVETMGKECHEHLGSLSRCTNRKPSVDQLIRTERAVSDFLGDHPTSPATISVWSPLQPHLSRLHQVVFLQISQCFSYMLVTTQWALFAELLLHNTAVPLNDSD